MKTIKWRNRFAMCFTIINWIIKKKIEIYLKDECWRRLASNAKDIFFWKIFKKKTNFIALRDCYIF